MIFDRVGVRHAVGNVSHTMEVKGADEEALDKASDLGVIMRVSSLSNNCDNGGSESTIHIDVVEFKLL